MGIIIRAARKRGLTIAVNTVIFGHGPMAVILRHGRDYR